MRHSPSTMMSAKMERIDSGTTDDSPFASSLTTPVDEDVQLQLRSHGLGMGMERLFGLSKEKEIVGFAESVPAIYVGSPEDRGAVVSENEFRKELEKKLSALDPILPTKSMIMPSVPTISTLSESPVLFSQGLTATSTPDLGSIPNQPMLLRMQMVSQGSTAESTPDLRPRSESIYNFPNEPISVETGSQPHLPSENEHVNENIYSAKALLESRSHNTVPQQILDSAAGDVDLVAANDKLKVSPQCPKSFDAVSVKPVESNIFVKSNTQYDFSALPFAEAIEDSSLATQSTNFTHLHLSSLVQTLLPLLLRILLFLPWCAAVGGTIVMCPKYLELIAFGPGYLESPKGIRRFAHWAETGMQQVWIFWGFLASVWWLYPTLGCMLIGGVAAQAANAWQDFKVDRTVPLGEDDRQTMYLVATQYGVPDELMGIRKTEKGYVISKLNQPHVEIEDLDDDN